MAEEQSGRGGAGVVAAGAALGLGLGRLVQGALATPQEADLYGQVALVTGGSRGLGLALSRELTRRGCRLAICARDEAELDVARQDLLGIGAEVLAIPCDVADRDRVAAMVEAVTGHYGRIDILVNNAGIIAVGPLEALTYEDLERVMAVNFWGTVNPALAVLPAMRARGGGRIVNITSIGGKIAVPHLLPYTCAKFAAVGFSHGLRAELAGAGITVTTVVPGLMRTGSFLHAEFSGEHEAEYRWFALGSSAPYPITVSAERAARIIVQATARGDAECTYPFTTTLATRFADLLPGVTADILSLVDRLLPDAPPRTRGPVPGSAIEAAMDAPYFEMATALGRAAAKEYNQMTVESGDG